MAKISREFFENAQTGIMEIANHVDPDTGAIGVPISRAVTYATRMEGRAQELARTLDGGPGYGIYRNPAWEKLEEIIAYIESDDEIPPDSEKRPKGLVTSSGRSAIDLILKLLPKDSHIIVAPDDIYPGTRALFESMGSITGLEVTYTQSTREALEKARRSNTRMILTEPLTNPRMKVSDLKIVSDFAKEYKILSVADNTVTPLLVKPLSYGFDIALHSLTKYVAGNNQTMGGAIVTHKNRADLHAELYIKRNRTGAVLSAENAVTLIEQAKEFPTRLAAHNDNALKIAEWLVSRPEISKVHHTDLSTHPDHELAKKQFKGHGGLFSFELEGGIDQVGDFFSGLKDSKRVFLADSFGADITLLGWTCNQTTFFRDLPENVRISQFGITDTFMRFAAGRARAELIIEDIEKGLDAIRPRAVAVAADIERDYVHI